MASIGNFFESAATAQPVNPRPVKFTVVAKGEVLPGGTRNPGGRRVKARCEAAFVFLSGDETASCRLAAREALRERCALETPDGPRRMESDENDYNVELVYQLLQRALREWDPDERVTGEPFFATVKLARELLSMREAVRLSNAYDAYVDEEHAEVIDTDTFRGARRPGAGAPAEPPR